MYLKERKKYLSCGLFWGYQATYKELKRRRECRIYLIPWIGYQATYKELKLLPYTVVVWVIDLIQPRAIDAGPGEG
ncbi:hypothetical protein [Paludifilum halophilum]|uniref:Uncharacterized protein n=1 Tax=Paludifilum halophilum TaxID=1642702 RepID=A0A235B1W0_9BACL|nr:hypothetical protein [Paludifilum halophilum]OYD06211.1 hypothetical protein CHM34_17275 [Paludifilum halophilum]